MANKYLVIIISVTLLLLTNCGHYDRYNTPHVSSVYNRHGKVVDFKYFDNKKKVINYWGYASKIEGILSETPHKKIDKIIESNPDFQFLFYVDRIEEKDTTRIIDILNKYDADFAIIADFNGEFYKYNKNKMQHRWTAIGYICNEKNKLFGVSVIGTPKSFFDKNFASAKRKMK